MADHKITDFVDQSAIDGLKRLKDELLSAKEAYIQTASELAKGLKAPVDGLDQLEKLTKQVADLQRQAAEATKKHNAALEEQSRIAANTTNTISRQLMEQERVNKTTRESYTEQEKVKKLLEQFHDTYENQLQSLVKVNAQLKANSKEQKDNEKMLSMGRISMDKFTATQAELIAQHRSLTQEKRTLTQIMTAEEKATQSQEGSYVHMSQQLELLKKAYKDLSEEGRNADFGKELEMSIQNLDAHLKDVAADMGEFQRNVGNYAIAGQKGVVSTESLNEVLAQAPKTIQDVVDQTKILEEARRMLDKSDANYADTLRTIDEQLASNKASLTDVTDIINKDATTVAEAEAQNKRLQEALKYVDLSADDAQQRIDSLNHKIDANNAVIEKSTSTTEKKAKAEKEAAEAAKKLADEEKKLAEEERKAAKEAEELQKKNEGVADTLLNLIGINTNLGSSFRGIGEGGNVLDGINTKVSALGKTLMGLLSNPWVLTFLGIGGVVAGFKWWYDYNKGLIEASRLTENFTGATGAAADKVTADMQTLAEKMGKGYDVTIGAANTLVQQFGMSWDVAYRKMKDGISAGADMSGNMVANIERFAPAMRDAGVSADEFMAILAETRNGIFNEDGIQNIVKGGTRLRAMTKQTEESLNAVGISAKQMQKDLEDGNISMLDAVKQVAGKLKEIPENSQEAGQIMKNVFGRTAAEGGTLLIQSIADINTNLDKAKENMGELGKVNEEQMDAQRELNEVLMAVFKMSGTSFETMTANAKTFVAQGITGIIKGCVDIVNWFIEIYNKSQYIRTEINYIKAVFLTLWDVVKAVFALMFNGFKALGGAIDGVLSIMNGDFSKGFDKIKSSVADGFKNMADTVISTAKEIGTDVGDAYADAVNSRLEKVSLELDGDDIDSGDSKSSTPKNKPTPIDGGLDEKEAEKRAKEELKRLHELEESKISILEEGHEKDLALIRLKFKKKLDEIKGNGDTEQALRIQLAEQCEKEVAQCELNYQRELAKINLDNRLASVEEGSKEELDLKLAQLESQRAAEIESAKKTGADVSLINDKFNRQRAEMLEDYAAEQVEKSQQAYAVESAIADNAYNQQLNKLNAKYAEELKAAGNNQAKREEITRKHEKSVALLTEYYAQQKAQASIDSIEQMLNAENLSAEDRLKLEDRLAKAKIELEKAVTDAVIAENQRQVDNDTQAYQKRIANAQRWLQVASDGLNAINELASTIFDAKIERIEAEQDANTEAGEAEQERITELVEQNVITEEEGEARKRAAEEKTARKNEELEKKKQQLKYKQAVWDKANNLAQAGIATALAITQALPNVALAALAGAMGAIQIATIVATPIPKYAKGTKDHPGGLAIVGDGGRQEVVSYGGNMFLTPDTPTLIEMPKGAEVFPDADKFIASNADLAGAMQQIGDSPQVIVNNDYSDLKREVAFLCYLIKMQTKAQRKFANRSNYEHLKVLYGL